MSQSPWLPDKQVAIRLHVSRVTVWRWAASGRLPPPVRLGPHTTRWRLADIEAFEAQRVAASTAAAPQDAATDPA